MASHVYSSDLSVKGIQKLKKDIKKYQNQYLPRKCKQLAKKLSDIGIVVAKAKIDESPLGKYITISTNLSSDSMGTKAIIIALGEVKESEGYEPFSTLLAVEFGAGIHHNPTDNPKSDELGFGVGTFPGQIHAFEDGWYFWDDTEQKWRYTQGVKATMPMYSASIEMITSVVKVAREVFG